MSSGSKERSKQEYEGKVYTNAYGDVCEVETYVSSTEVYVKFNNLSCNKRYTASQLKNSRFKNPNKPCIFGVAYIGYGKFSEKRDTKAYNLWRRVLGRCYDVNLRSKNPSYEGVTIWDGWHNFQNFAEWCYGQKGFQNLDKCGEIFQLDKDILVRGNKMYSPETCCFVPRIVNMSVTKGVSKKGLPVGVSYKSRDKKYQATVNKGKLNKYIGYFDNLSQAFSAYKSEKEGYIKELAEVWKKEISEEAYKALMSYEVPQFV